MIVTTLGKCNGSAKISKQVNKANQHAVAKVREFGPLGGMCLCPFYRSASRVRRITDSAQQRTASERGLRITYSHIQTHFNQKKRKSERD